VNAAVVAIAPAVVAWQREHGRRHLPWQVRDPYRVWLSEIMLQQTQVTTVLGYYARFLERFPDVAALAAAPLDEVLAMWAGLGYYSRARNLHRCAQAVVADWGGAFPRRAQDLQTLPGIGRSTAAAIAAFCFDERVAILDGNVKRVLTRVLAFDGDLATAREEKRLWALATDLLPEDPADMVAYTQGLMDLGAGPCSAKSPACLSCPLHGRCAAGDAGDAERFPVKTRTIRRGTRENVWLWLQWRNQAWLQQRPDTGVWAGLWTLPLLEDDTLAQALARAAGVRLQDLPSRTHVLTHLDWLLHPRQLRLDESFDEAACAALLAPLVAATGPGRWVPLPVLAQGDQVGVPAPLLKLLREAPGG
jgi:A/G-specific adenine glycosylase